MPYVKISITDERVTKNDKRKLISGVTQLLQETLNKNPETTVVIIDVKALGRGIYGGTHKFSVLPLSEQNNHIWQSVPLHQWTHTPHRIQAKTFDIDTQHIGALAITHHKEIKTEPLYFDITNLPPIFPI